MFLLSSHCGVSCEVADWMRVLDTGFFMALYVLGWSNQIILGIPLLSIAGNEASSHPVVLRLAWIWRALGSVRIQNEGELKMDLEFFSLRLSCSL